MIMNLHVNKYNWHHFNNNHKFLNELSEIDDILICKTHVIVKLIVFLISL